MEFVPTGPTWILNRSFHSKTSICPGRYDKRRKYVPMDVKDFFAVDSDDGNGLKVHGRDDGRRKKRALAAKSFSCTAFELVSARFRLPKYPALRFAAC